MPALRLTIDTSTNKSRLSRRSAASMSDRTKKKLSRKKQQAKAAATDEHGNVRYNDETKKTKAEERRAKNLARMFFWMIVGPSVLGGGLGLWSWLSPSYTNISLDDENQLRDVFFSGNPWLVMCAPYPGYPNNEVFESLVNNAWTRKTYRAGMIDCNAKLPSSGKTVVERFKLNYQKGYNRNALAFWVANGGKPKVLPAKMLLPPTKKKKKEVDVAARAVSVDEYVAKKVAVRYGKATNAAQLKRGCLSKKVSAVVLSEGDPSTGTMAALENLVNKFRTVRFCLVDHSKYKLGIGKKATWNKNFKELLSQPMEEGEARLVMFMRKKSDSKDAGGSGSGGGMLQAQAFEGTIEGPPDVSSFLANRLAPGGSEMMHQVSAKKVSLRYRGKNWNKKKKQTKKGDEDVEKNSEKSSSKKPSGKKRRKEARKRKDEEAQKQNRGQEQRAKKSKKDGKQQKDATDSISQEQREREARRRREMDREAEQHYAQAAEDYDEDDGHGEEEDFEEIVLDEDEDEDEEDDDVIDLDEM